MAEATAAAQSALQKSSLQVEVNIYKPRRWQVTFLAPDRAIAAEVHIDDRTAKVVGAYSGMKAANRGARGSKALVDEGEIGTATDSPFVWIPLSLLFLLPLVDWRRLGRGVHLDALALLTFAALHLPSASGDLRLWSLLLYPCLVLLLVRLVQAARHPESQDAAAPWATTRLLVAGAVALFAARAALNIVNSIPADVAYGNVEGADRILHGQQLYTAGGLHYDTYGPWSYLLYVPFRLLFPYHGISDAALVPAHAASLMFDALTAGMLFLVGRQMRAGAAGNRLGALLAYLWFANPFTWNALAWNTNDAIVSFWSLLALYLLRRPIASGVSLGVAASAKFVSFGLFPLFFAIRARASGRRAAISFAIAGALVVVVALIPLLPPGGLREFWDATLGFQFNRSYEAYSIWGWYPGLAPLQHVLQVAVVAAILAVALKVRVTQAREVAAWSAAIVVAMLIPLGHVAEPYFLWFLPFSLVGLFARYR